MAGSESGTVSGNLNLKEMIERKEKGSSVVWLTDTEVEMVDARDLMEL